jgi:pyruvate,water dikinase
VPAADRAAVGVLVQRMIQPTVSGVAFTVDPVTASDTELVINAAPGLGVAVVDGSVNPDEIRVRKADGHIASYQAAGGSLGAPQIAELTTILTAIEHVYGAPQDVEWCYDGARFWIVQARPVTNLRPLEGARHDFQGTELGRGTEIEWTRANLAEVLPEHTSPQALVEIEQMLNLAERRYMGGFIAPYSELGPMVRSFHGRMYFNLTQMRRVCFVTATPPAAVLRSLGHAGDIPPEDEVTPRPPVSSYLAHLPDFVRILRRHLRAEKLLRAHERTIDGFLKGLSAFEPKSLPDDRLWAVISDWQMRSADTIEIVLLFGGVLFWEQQLRKICEGVGFPFERLLYSHLAAGQRSVSAQQAFDLVALADVARAEPRAADWLLRSETLNGDLRASLAGTRFLTEFDQFLDRYGHRGLYESDWALPRFREDPAPLLHAIRMHLRDGHDQTRAENPARADAEAAETRTEFEQRLTGVKRWTLLPRARKLLATIKHYYVWREQCRSDMIRVAAALRAWHLVLADRFVDRGWLDRQDDYFFLLFDEIERAIRDGSDADARGSTGSPRAEDLRALVSKRRVEMERNRRIEMPLLMRESELPALIAQAARPPAALNGDEGADLRGTPVSRGSVEGEVVVITDPGDFGSMKRGAILVARATDPSWTPLFTLAAGVIVEVGGVLSHASTIAREYGLPALANVPQATRRLRTGDRIVLNASEGWARRC